MSKAASAMPARTKRRMSGARAGVIVFIGMVIANIGNYIFQLVAARSLGPGSYGDLAGLLAVAALGHPAPRGDPGGRCT